MERDAFIFYKTFFDAVKMFPKRDQNRLLLAIIELGLTDKIDETLPLKMQALLLQIQASISGAQKRHERAVQNGKKGGAPRGNQNAAKKNDENNQNNLKVDSKNNQNNLNKETKTKRKTKSNPLRISNNTSSDLASPDGGQSSDDDGWMTGKELRENGIV